MCFPQHTFAIGPVRRGSRLRGNSAGMTWLKLVVLTLLKLVPLGIIGRAGLCKLHAVAGGLGASVPQVDGVCAAYPEAHLVSAQNLADWSPAWAKHWNQRLAPLDLGVAVDGTQMLVAIGLVEVVGFVFLFTSPRRGGLLLAAVMAGAIDTHINGFGQGIGAVQLQILYLFISLLIALNAPAAQAAPRPPKVATDAKKKRS